MASQPTFAAAVTPDDNNNLTNPGSLFIGTSGDVAAIPVGGSVAVTWKNHPVGYFPTRVKRVLSTGTTASNIVVMD